MVVKNHDFSGKNKEIGFFYLNWILKIEITS